jgi:predicted nucleotidyltransferase
MSKAYKELGIQFFKEAFEIIDGVLRDHEVPYYLIGATAVSLKLLASGFRPARATKDIDFAILLSDIEQFEAVVHGLVKHGFTKVEAPWTLYHPQFNLVIDLLPFGAIEQEHSVRFNERYTDLHLLGFKEVLEDSASIRIEHHLVNVPSWAGMVILKLIAWSDRPEERQNDLRDVLLIIKSYYETSFEEVLEHHYDLFDKEEEVDDYRISAQALGRMAGFYLLKSEKLKNRIVQVLESNAFDLKRPAPIAIEWARLLDQTVEYAQRILASFLEGLNEGVEKEWSTYE